MRLDDSTDTRANLLAALSRSPELIGSTRGDGTGFISVEVSPMARSSPSARPTATCRSTTPSTRKLLGSYDELPVWELEFRADGRQLAVTAQPANDRKRLVQPSVRLVETATWNDEPVQLGGIPPRVFVSAPHYSGDGRFLAAEFEELEVGGESSVVVWDLASPHRPVLKLDLPGIDYAVELSPDGSRLYVSRFDPPAVTDYDVATGRSLRSVDEPGAWGWTSAPTVRSSPQPVATRS